MNILKFFRRTPPPAYTCEICKSEGVIRVDIWDYCPEGHTYVGIRVEQNNAD